MNAPTVIALVATCVTIAFLIGTVRNLRAATRNMRRTDAYVALTDGWHAVAALHRRGEHALADELRADLAYAKQALSWESTRDARPVTTFVRASIAHARGKVGRS